MDDDKLLRIMKDSKVAICQPKLDGERAWVMWEDDEPYLISSTGSIIQSVPHIPLALKEFAKITGERYSFDGELYRKGWSFEQIHSIVGRKVNLSEDYSCIEYHIFDIKQLDKPQISRIGTILELFNMWEEKADDTLSSILKMVLFKICNNIEDVHTSYKEFVNAGYEGIVVRHMHAPYKIGRPWYILKFKPKRNDTYNFVGFEEAISQTGEPLKRVGAIVCSDAEGVMFKVGTGTGLSNCDLERLWNNRSSYNSSNKVLVEYQNLTETGGVPRFGKFVEII